MYCTWLHSVGGFCTLVWGDAVSEKTVALLAYQAIRTATGREDVNPYSTKYCTHFAHFILALTRDSLRF